MPGKYVAGTHSGPRARFSPPQSLGYHAEVRLLIADFWLLIEDRAPKRLRFFNQQSRINNRTPQTAQRLDLSAEALPAGCIIRAQMFE
jgi:hypothetical protein